MKDDEIMKFNQELQQLLTDKNNLMIGTDEKGKLVETLTQEIKRNEEIVSNFNSINKDFNDKERIIKELKYKIIQMEKGKQNEILFDLIDNE
jgi:predicted RNase H-like nuclease (RuvC/YqgF family)